MVNSSCTERGKVGRDVESVIYFILFIIPNSLHPTTRVRKKSRFHSSRLVQKTVDKVAHRIYSSRSHRKNIDLFGNSSSGAKTGDASAPRKKIVRAISSRVVIGILDEFRTSKRCPRVCGGDVVDVSGAKRVHQCTTGLLAGVDNPCPIS